MKLAQPEPEVERWLNAIVDRWSQASKDEVQEGAWLAKRQETSYALFCQGSNQ